MCSSACLAAAPIFDAAGYTTISPSCTNPRLTTSDFTSFNRAVASDAAQGVVAANFLYNNLGVRKIATIHDGSAYGEGLVAVVTSTFEALGGEVVKSDAISVGDTDFRGLLEDIAQEDPELIYFGGFPAEAARMAEQRADAGLEDVPMFAGDGILGTEFVELAGSSARDVYATSSVPTVSEALDAFLATYVETYGEQPPAPYHANAYDAANLFLDAVEAVGTIDSDGNLVVDRAALSEYIRSVEGYEGLIGVLTNDGTGELVTSGEFTISQVQDGAFTAIAMGAVADGVVTISPVEATPESTAEATPAS
jgi:branched-chain amino acid transport system substrate-binding protein